MRSNVGAAAGYEVFASRRYDEARELFDRVSLADDFVEFLTLTAYERLS